MKRIALFLLALLLLAGCRGTVSLAHADQTATEAPTPTPTPAAEAAGTPPAEEAPPALRSLLRYEFGDLSEGQMFSFDLDQDGVEETFSFALRPDDEWATAISMDDSTVVVAAGDEPVSAEILDLDPASPFYNLLLKLDYGSDSYVTVELHPEDGELVQGPMIWGSYSLHDDALQGADLHDQIHLRVHEAQAVEAGARGQGRRLAVDHAGHGLGAVDHGADLDETRQVPFQRLLRGGLHVEPDAVRDQLVPAIGPVPEIGAQQAAALREAQAVRCDPILAEDRFAPDQLAVFRVELHRDVAVGAVVQDDQQVIEGALRVQVHDLRPDGLVPVLQDDRVAVPGEGGGPFVVGPQGEGEHFLHAVLIEIEGEHLPLGKVGEPVQQQGRQRRGRLLRQRCVRRRGGRGAGGDLRGRRAFIRKRGGAAAARGQQQGQKKEDDSLHKHLLAAESMISALII